MFASFDENPALTLQDIKEAKRYGQTDACTDNVKTVYPPQTKFAGGITSVGQFMRLWHVYITYGKSHLEMHKQLF